MTEKNEEISKPITSQSIEKTPITRHTVKKAPSTMQSVEEMPITRHSFEITLRKRQIIEKTQSTMQSVKKTPSTRHSFEEMPITRKRFEKTQSTRHSIEKTPSTRHSFEEMPPRNHSTKFTSHWTVYKQEEMPNYIFEAKKRLGLIREPNTTPIIIPKRSGANSNIIKTTASQRPLFEKSVTTLHKNWSIWDNPATPLRIREIRANLGDDRYKILRRSQTFITIGKESLNQQAN
jgi:hypothetical protein